MAFKLSMRQAHFSWCSLTSKYTKHCFLFCFWQLKASCLCSMLSFGPQKHQPYVFFSFQTFNYIKRTLIHVFLPRRHHAYIACCILTSKKIIRTLLLAFCPLFTSFTVYFELFKSQKRRQYLPCLFTASKTTIVTFA